MGPCCSAYPPFRVAPKQLREHAGLGESPRQPKVTGGTENQLLDWASLPMCCAPQQLDNSPLKHLPSAQGVFTRLWDSVGSESARAGKRVLSSCSRERQHQKAAEVRFLPSPPVPRAWAPQVLNSSPLHHSTKLCSDPPHTRNQEIGTSSHQS
ncbi:hypothetical protein N656DRAFT_774851 [Canariomyces notabilis]|uniref:Uncharacterized protein n=1 Tax=Canariomyces notabilis TaxID=2074819 RepID=A0AAN6YWE4_9PEZI|nr:hypothetical protein N656DRAFT_774851 [Canariomyces arenarius]